MPAKCWFAGLVFACLALGLPTRQAMAYDPPAPSLPLLRGVDLTTATPLDENYRLQFVACDEGVTGVGPKDHFRGHRLRLAGRPDSKQYICAPAIRAM